MFRVLILALIPVMAICYFANRRIERKPIAPPSLKIMVPPPSPDQKIEDLRREAKSRGIRWFIFCVPGADGDADHYQAEGFQPGDNSMHSRYVEDGAKDWWAETAPTSDEAAYVLSKAIRNAPDMPVDHKPVDRPKRATDCSFNTVLDSEHETKLPCKSEYAKEK